MSPRSAIAADLEQRDVSTPLVATRTKEGREQLDGGLVTLAIVRAHIQWVIEYASREDLHAIVAALPSGAGELLLQVDAPNQEERWIPFSWLVQFDRATARQLAIDSATTPELMRDFGRYSARLNLPRYFPLEQKQQHQVLETSAKVHRQYQNFGRSFYTQTGSSSGSIQHVDSRCFSSVYCLSAAGYYEQLLLTYGATGVRIRELRCICMGDPICEFELRWR